LVKSDNMLELSPTIKKLMQGLLAALIGSAVAFGLWLPGWLDTWEAKTWDKRVNLLAKPGKATEKINIILLDQDSLDWGNRENGLAWPWPREIYSAVISFCKRNGAKVLAFDVLFTEPSKYGVDDDRSLGLAIAGFSGFVGSVFVSQTIGMERLWPGIIPEPKFRINGMKKWLIESGARDINYHRASFPVLEIAANVSVLANVHLDPDQDSIYRRGTFFSVFDGKVLPSLGFGAYLAANSNTKMSIVPGFLSVNDRTIPIDGEGRAILNFRGPSGTHKAFSAAAIIQSELRYRNGEPQTIKETEAFRDSYVLFGMSAPGLFDLRPSPVSGVYPGVEIHATMLDNLLSNDFISTVPVSVLVALTLLMSLLAGVGTSYVSGIFKSSMVYAATFTLPVAVCLIAYTQGIWLPLVVQEVAVTITLLGAGLIYYAMEGRQKIFIKNAFKQYLSPTVIEELIQHPERLKLGGERRDLSIFFSDLEGFTSISEGLEPEVLTALLNEYLTAMTDIIQEEGGTVDKYEGDAIIAFWNAPLQQADHAGRCVRSAMRCQAKLAEMKPSIRERIGRDLRMRIGINSGPAVVGNLGSHSRFDYSMLGDAVNLAARLEGINKQFGTYTIISEATRERMAEAFPVREISRVAVVGRKDPVTVYEPLAFEEFAAKEKQLALFSDGLSAFYGGRFAVAMEIFAGIKDRDPAAASYVEKCRSLLDHPPEKWDGVWVITSK
jgi:adenylate cyclase